LVGATNPGDPEEVSLDFDTVFRRYAPYIASIGMKILGAEDELDDLVQEVFLQAHRGLADIREPGALRSWLARICVRRAMRRLKRRRLRAWFSLETVPVAALPNDQGASPEQSAEVAGVYRLLGRMPAEDRAAWVLRHVEGESLDDIANMCNCSKSTVQRRLRAAHEVFEREARR
jgi:RNA polymerase sigma-70 factor (ECF subfamily)